MTVLPASAAQLSSRMPTHADFSLASCQATLFTPEAQVSPARLLTRLLPRWISRFDGEPITLPVPEGIPREIPRVILQSRSTNWRCDVAPGRINVFWQRVAPGESPNTLRDVYQEMTSLLTEYCEFIDSRVGRLAAIVNRYTPHSSPGRFLASHFCKEKWMAAPFNRPASFELHAHKVFPLAGRFQVNSWVRNKTGMLTGPTGEQSIVLVEQDLNTLAEEEETRAFSQEEIAGFFQVAVPGFDEILSLYYPSDRQTQRGQPTQ